MDFGEIILYLTLQSSDHGFREKKKEKQGTVSLESSPADRALCL